MKSFLSVSVLVICIGLISCQQDLRDECPNSWHSIDEVTSFLVSEKFVQDVTLDTETHEYSFQVSENKILCSVGYQGIPNKVDYKIVLKDKEGNILVHQELEYPWQDYTYRWVPEVELEKGKTYTIQRTALNYVYNTQTIGPGMIHRPDSGKVRNIPFPISVGDLTIASTPNPIFLPMIGLGLKDVKKKKK